MNTYRRLFLILFVLISLTSLGCPGIVPGSKPYEGLSEREADHFNRSQRDISPSAVRSRIAQYQSTEVAWPGLIKEVELIEKEGKLEAQLLVEYYHYDWILDYGVQMEKIFLYPQREGLFATTCSFRPDASSSKQFRSYAEVGNLLILYGTPQRVDGQVVVLTCNYPRFITKGWFRIQSEEVGVGQ